mgnify:CR=1 FL=1
MDDFSYIKFHEAYILLKTFSPTSRDINELFFSLRGILSSSREWFTQPESMWTLRSFNGTSSGWINYWKEKPQYHNISNFKTPFSLNNHENWTIKLWATWLKNKKISFCWQGPTMILRLMNIWRIMQQFLSIHWKLFI